MLFSFCSLGVANKKGGFQRHRFEKIFFGLYCLDSSIGEYCWKWSILGHKNKTARNTHIFFSKIELHLALVLFLLFQLLEAIIICSQIRSLAFVLFVWLPTWPVSSGPKRGLTLIGQSYMTKNLNMLSKRQLSIVPKEEGWIFIPTSTTWFFEAIFLHFYKSSSKS